jgi:hypothetical protein
MTSIVSRPSVRAALITTFAPSRTELQSVVKEVGDRGAQQARVRFDEQVFWSEDDDLDPLGLGLDGRVSLELVQEGTQRDGREPRHHPQTQEAWLRAPSIMSPMRFKPRSTMSTVRLCASSVLRRRWKASFVVPSGLRSSCAMNPRCSELCR